VTVDAGDARREGEMFITVSPRKQFSARNVEVPGDVSSAAYFIAAAALLENSKLEIPKVGINPGRTLFLSHLKFFGLDVNIDDEREINHEPVGIVRAKGLRNGEWKRQSQSSQTINRTFVPGLIDEIPLLGVVGSQLEGGIEIRNAKELRVKESDRIAATVTGLRAMGAEVEEFDDGLRVAGPVRLRGAEIHPRGDHRIAMAFTVAALIAEGESEIKDPDCVAVSCPEFFDLMESVIER
jgi:3-phosphoshikimate 1-carboxyvinyltransferase